MTPRRAKGLEFCSEARRQAGLSEAFIHELKHYTGSKGRPPILWIYNPHCDSEIARGLPGFTASQGARRLSQDLEHLPMFLALDKDLVLVKERPRTDWIASLQEIGFKTPEFSEYKGLGSLQSIRPPKLGGIEPWGWSPDTLEGFRPLHPRLVQMNEGNSLWCERLFQSKDFRQTGLGKLFSKTWSVQFLREWLVSHPNTHHLFGPPELVGSSYSDWVTAKEKIGEILAESQDASAMVKAPFGTAGRQVRQVRALKELSGPVGGWIQNILSSQGAIVVEHRLEKVCDLSIQIEVKEEGIQLLEVRHFITGPRNEYRGTYLGAKFRSLAPKHARFLHSVFNEWREFVRDAGLRLREEGYRGPAGIDALMWSDKTGNFKIKPMVEINPRWTMGRVALELEKQLAPGVSALWAFLPLREIMKRGFENVESFARELERRHPIHKTTTHSGENRIQSGVVFTNDPLRAKEVLTVIGTLPNADLENYLKPLLS